MIDEAIEKYKEITNTGTICPAHCNISCDKCEQESEQIVEWLEELKKLRQCTNIENREYPYFNGFKEGKQVGYNKAIDDFVNNIKEELDRFEVQNLDTCVLYDLIDRKAGNKNES